MKMNSPQDHPESLRPKPKVSFDKVTKVLVVSKVSEYEATYYWQTKEDEENLQRDLVEDIRQIRSHGTSSSSKNPPCRRGLEHVACPTVHRSRTLERDHHINAILDAQDEFDRNGISSTSEQAVEEIAIVSRVLSKQSRERALMAGVTDAIQTLNIPSVLKTKQTTAAQIVTQAA